MIILNLFYINAGTEGFCSDGSELYIAFFSNLALPLFSSASIKVKLNNLENFSQSVAVKYNSGDEEIELGARASAEISLPIELRLEALGEQDKAVFIQSENGARLSVTACGTECASSDTYQVIPNVFISSSYE